MSTPTKPPTPATPANPADEGRWSDERVEMVVGVLLRWGVMIAAAVAAAGAVLYLAHHGTLSADYRQFRGASDPLRGMRAIFAGLRVLNSRAVVQFGLLLLIATPVSRVALSLFAFHKQGDRTYVLITAIVLALLLYSLFGGAGA